MWNQTQYYVGQAGGRAGITMERIAINVDDARILIVISVN